MLANKINLTLTLYWVPRDSCRPWCPDKLQLWSAHVSSLY